MASAAKKTTLASALVAAQGELKAPTKNREVSVKMKTGGTYKFAYATLDAIVENLLRPVLPGHGLWFVQGVKDHQMVTTIVHESGETLDCGVPMPNLPNAPQEAGSLISYFKRYSLCAAFGLVAEEDDDGNVASGNGYKAHDRNGTNGTNGKIDDGQWAQLVQLIEAKGADTERFCRYLDVPSLKDIPARRFGDAVKALEAKPDKAKEREPA